MKHAILLTVVITVTQLSFARPAVANNPRLKNDGDSILAKIPDPRQMLQDIIEVTGLHADFELKQADVLNIQASISHRKREILYNPEYVTWLNKLTRDKWSVLALIAHEVGHHLNGHTIRKGGSSPQVELEADEFAGFILYKLGATLEEAQKVMNYIAGINASDTHPGRMARKQAIQTGWDKAAGAGSLAKASH
ncbi:MAG TPA: hypothetical protein VGO58_16460 [Chitinophagaceae bacterium]|nr:hypothetical protein [Chitinophagaceae bacterium]